ncbi:cob(I)yrinic acid a,c-diamide adenosyltransferase [Candidatus Azambacteria bacterium]|nr:cob(I)yrinic acid a,c-diamide adenosyltransferase [Candidatus Azambacteria bacterium]
MIIVNTGNGKGKTTAALGQALRAVGEGKKAIMIQFIKGPFRSGEDTAHKRLAPDFSLVKGGIGFVGIMGDKHKIEEHKEAAEKTWAMCKEAVLSGEYNLVAMDEINNAMDLKLIKEEEVKNFLDEYKGETDMILTGRNAPVWLIEKADLVTEMKDIKHPYDSGVRAKRGIEF